MLRAVDKEYQETHLSPDFTFVVCDDPEYEDLIAELSYRNELFCIISQEQGFEMLDIEIHGSKSSNPWRFKLIEMEEAISIARQRLFELRKET